MEFLSKTNSLRRSLILAGGGVRLAYHAGVLKALEEEGLSFNHVDGTSGGIFGTAMLASGIPPADAARRWRALKLEGFMGILPLKEYGRRHAKLFNGADGIKNAVFPSLGIAVDKINANNAFDATFNVCNFSKKRVESIPQSAVKLDHLIAGMSLPMFMPATKINGDWYTDAVWIKDANLTEALNRGAEEVWLIWCIGNTPSYHHGRFNEYVHMIEISANAGVMNELEWINQANKLRQENGEKPVVVHVIRPQYPLPLDPDFFLQKIDADTLINMGYADTKAYLQHRETSPVIDPQTATLMIECEATLSFRQQFYGSVLIGERKEPVCLRVAFFIRKNSGNYMLQQFASLLFASTNEVVSGYENSVSKTGKGELSGRFCVLHNNTVLTVNFVVQLNNSIDLLFGLDCKRATVAVSSKPGEKQEMIFVQPAWNRVKNALHLTVNGDLSLIKKWKRKRSLLNYISD